MKNDKNNSIISSAIEVIPASILVILAIICYQLGAVVGKSLFGVLGPSGTILFRVGFSAMFLVIAQRGIPRHIRGKALFWTALYGFTIAMMNFTFYSSFSRIPLGIASTIEFAGPLAIAVIGSKKIIDFIWIIMAGAGIMLFAPWTGAKLDELGVILALIAAFCWAIYIVLTAKVGKLVPGRSGLALAMVFGTLLMLPIGISGAKTQLLNPFAIGTGLLLAFLSSTLPYSLEIEALRKMATHTFGILVSLEPAIATIAGVILLHQGLTTRSVIALILVTIASIGATLGKNRNVKPPIVD